MEKLDPSTKKQLNLLLAKTTSATASKQLKPIVSTVPLALIRKAMLIKTKDEIEKELVIESPIMSSSPLRTSPTKTPSKLSPSKSNYELSSTPTIKQSRLSFGSNYDFSPRKIVAEAKSKLSPSKSVSSFSSDVPMDKIFIPLASPEKIKGSPMEIDGNYGTNSDVLMDAQSSNLESEDEEIILNVPNVMKNSTPSTPRVIQKEVEKLTNELPHKIRFFHEPSSVNTIINTFFCNLNNSPVRRSNPLTCSSPSVSSRIKSLGLAAGTPLRAAIYRNSSNPEVLDQSKFNYNSSSLLNDLIEEFCNTRDEECFKKILSLTSVRTGDFDGLTSDLVHKLFISSIGIVNFTLNSKLLTNFLDNESFLLSSSGREVIEILEEQFRNNPDNIETLKTIAKSNLVTILIENCIEMCCERLSEFKLILLEEFIRNFIGTNLKEILMKSITPLILVSKFYLFIN